MYRSLCVSVLNVCYVASEALGAPGTSVAAKPTLVCPKTELGNEKLQAQYDQMWVSYSADVDKATKKLQVELEGQRKAAQDAGNLNLLIFWQESINGFQQKGELSWSDAERRKTWGNRFGDAAFPEEFHVVIKKTAEDYSAAKEKLRAGYVDLEKAFTMAGDVPKALTMRNEFTQLGALLSPPPAPAPKPTPPKPVEKPNLTLPQSGKYKFVFSSQPESSFQGLLLEVKGKTLWIHGDLVRPSAKFPKGVAPWPSPELQKWRDKTEFKTEGGKVMVDVPAWTLTWDLDTGEASRFVKESKTTQSGKISPGNW